MPRISNSTVVTKSEATKPDIRRLYKQNMGKASKSWSFDSNKPLSIIDACRRCKLTLKETETLFLHLATTEPYPAWSDAN